MGGDEGEKIRPAGTIFREVMRNRMRRQDATPSGRSRTTLPDLLRKCKRDILPRLTSASAASSNFFYCKTKFGTCQARRKKGEIRPAGMLSCEVMRTAANTVYARPCGLPLFGNWGD